MLLWKAADKSDPPDIQLTDYGWEVKEHEHVMPAVSREPAAPSKLLDVISCSFKAEGRVKPVVESVAVGLVDYRASATVSVKEGIIAGIHILNRRRTKTSHSGF